MNITLNYREGGRTHQVATDPLSPLALFKQWAVDESSREMWGDVEWRMHSTLRNGPMLSKGQWKAMGFNVTRPGLSVAPKRGGPLMAVNGR